jgi:hypothetical protein
MDELCKVPCKDEKMLTCGGEWHYAVYTVTEFGNGTFQFSAPTWTKENTPVTFTFTAQNGTAIEVYRKHSAASTTLSYMELTIQDMAIEVI